jgi:hypothetical protein
VPILLMKTSTPSSSRRHRASTERKAGRDTDFRRLRQSHRPIDLDPDRVVHANEHGKRAEQLSQRTPGPGADPLRPFCGHGLGRVACLEHEGPPLAVIRNPPTLRQRPDKTESSPVQSHAPTTTTGRTGHSLSSHPQAATSATSPPRTRSSATTSSADSSTNTEPRHEHRFETLTATTKAIFA